MSQEEITALVEAEEQRLGVGSKEFMGRHNEIMKMIERCQKGDTIEQKECITCRWRYSCFPCLDEFEISKRNCKCGGENYDQEQ